MSARSAQGGFTVLEVLVALLVLGVGITALVGTSALVTRQVGRGRIVTIASQLVNQKLEDLRRAAAVKDVSGNRCTAAAFTAGGPVTSRGVTYGWTISGTGTAPRLVTVNAAYAVPGGTKSFSISTYVGCY
ncbi:MAG: prepilin-type N-terminal cleavage/methylation domain-containing protein [Deltaproteobacteria bacterium]